MENTIVLDTDILIDLTREKQDVVDWVKENEEKSILATTIVNIFELFYGAYKSKNQEKNILLINSILERVKIINLTLDSAHESGKQKAYLEKEGLAVEFRDILIGSIALIEKLPLKTNNKKHFERIIGLKLVK